MSSSPSATPVSVTGGRIAGRQRDGVHSFLGVPYAASLAGRNRWRAPQPVQPWEGVRNAVTAGEACHQPLVSPVQRQILRCMPAARAFVRGIHPAGLVEGDDCLNLNVFTPTLDPDARLPVMVWIHGGSFTAGSGGAAHYDGHALAARGMVVVSINYRLNVWGFIGGDDLFEGDTGVANRGYLDQVQALHWVQENIRRFGGNPDCITVAGESAGATSAVLLMASPLTDGLMHRVICLSGAAISVFPHAEVSRFSRDYLQEMHGVAPGDTEALCRLGIRDVLRASAGIGRFLARWRDRYGALGAACFTTMNAATDTAFLPVSPLDALRAGRKRGVELFIGTCRDEARLWTLLLPLPSAMAARTMFRLHAGILNPRGQLERVFDNYTAAMPGASATAVHERAMTDALFRRWSLAFAEAHAEASPGKTWWYRFDWTSPVAGGRLGAIHVIDLPGVFQTYRAYRAMVGDEANARPAGDALHEAIVAFIRHGQPRHAGLPDWPSFESHTKPCMVFDRESCLQHDIDGAFEAFW